MSRYIDAEFEIDHYTKITTHPTPDVSEKDKRDSLIILEALRKAKSIDIVRCRECTYWTYDDLCDEHICGDSEWTAVGVKADDFCSHGERDSEKPNNSEEWYTFKDEQEYNDRFGKE